MPNKMLIDASHPEETRVVVVRGSRIEEFDFESEHKKQIKGNIYLAKVTRVEPSLQAAFVEYGGNRHGFLAFSEIHPDYYQIPVADRQALMEDEIARVREEEEDEERKLAAPRRNPRRPGGGKSIRSAEASDRDTVSESLSSDEASEGDDAHDFSHDEHDAPELIGDDHDGSDDASDEGTEGETEVSASGQKRQRRSRSRRGSSNAEEAPSSDDDEEIVDEIGAEDAMEEVPVRQPRVPRKQYKIQEVIKRRQILLVQVVKEERGNKGAALTTYLSLAGRYSVLMPNTARGGGISRKITNMADRKRLKEVARELDVPKGMGIILRTAGAMRTKAEVKRDYEYLMRLWETVRSLTLASSAPTLVYEEGSLIKRSIRDLYNKDIDQVLVAGEAGYREAKDFMRMLMPGQSKVVQPYRDTMPIFARGGIEAQLDRMLQPHVTLKSGGYIIINQTEALVAIDVNSGRSTREHSVEDTAYQTNLEAAEEVARQLRLRDLAGLIVIDFIDMDEKRNNRAVEKKMKDCLKDDRARIQVGRISHFGLMEMSRQRIRASVLESTTRVCPTCDGVGHIRSNSSLALHVVRAIEEHVQKQSTHDIIVKVPTATALYVLNEKRRTIEELEAMHGLRITIEADDSHGHQHVAIEHGAEAVRREPQPPILSPVAFPEYDDEDDVEPEIADESETVAVADETEVEASDEKGDDAGGDKGDDQRRRKRRRRRRRGGSDDQTSEDGQEAGDSFDASGPDADVSESETSAEPESEGDEAVAGETGTDEGDDEAARARKRRRRGRRGGRKNRDGEETVTAEDADADAAENAPSDAGFPVSAFEEPAAEVHEDAAPAGSYIVEAIVAETHAESPAEVYSQPEPAAFEPAAEAAPAVAAPAPVATETPAPTAVVAEESRPAEAPVGASRPAEPAEPAADETGEAKPKRTGWWSRGFF